MNKKHILSGSLISIIPIIIFLLTVSIMGIEVRILIYPLMVTAAASIIASMVIVYITSLDFIKITGKIYKALELLSSGDFYGSLSPLKGHIGDKKIKSTFEKLISELAGMLEQFEISSQKNGQYSENLIRQRRMKDEQTRL
jgi:hypothetical protein